MVGLGSAMLRKFGKIHLHLQLENPRGNFSKFENQHVLADKLLLR